MGPVIWNMSMSLDGFIAGPDVSVADPMGVGGHRLHDWLFPGDADRTGRPPREVDLDPEDQGVIAEMFDRTGAVVMGRTTFTVGEAPWGPEPPFQVPCFVLTHRPNETVVKGETTFRFVTEGIDAALDLAHAAAGDRAVNLMGAEIGQQALAAGRLDAIRINLIAVLLGDGVRMFDHPGLDPEPHLPANIPARHIELERTRVVETPSATHLTFHVRR